MQRQPKHTPSVGAEAFAKTQHSSDGVERGGPLLVPGTRVQQYEIIREIGAGGMGQVVLARDTKLARLVALKFVNSSSDEVSQRFLNEARTTAKLSHENIVIIHEVSEAEGAPFMALEYLEGEPLRKLCQPGRGLPASRVVELMVPVVRALVRAHKAEIVHRDLKPENIIVTSEGQVKVLDFGLAKVFESDHQAGALARASAGGDEPTQVDPQAPDMGLTQEGKLMGTLPYMAPEQWGHGSIDHRTDIWAVGIMLFEMVSGQHPLAPITATKLLYQAGSPRIPMPSLGTVRDIPQALVAIADRCLQKDKKKRYANAQSLLSELEQLLPGHVGRTLREGESPYLGLNAFQEGDANRFFGRAREVQRAVKRIRDTPLMGVVGPTGVGKSSFVRAGLVPALKASGETWQALIVRPGRDPLASLANLLLPLLADIENQDEQHRALRHRIQSEPGYVGTLLRSLARRDNSHLLLFVDQFEELYTLVPDKAVREAFVAALVGIADDASSPLRVVVSMRSDFLDRLGESEHFLDALSQALIFLQPPNREGMHEALTLPIHMMGYQFESPSLISEMLDALATTPGALPLLQFAAASLWEQRDRERRLLTTAAYQSMGGVAGTLASHADAVLESLTSGQRALARNMFQRLVTSEGTRAIVDMSELQELHEDSTQVDRLIGHLVQARLLVAQTLAGEQTIEIVHESLISQWPVLRSWLDESQEDSAFLEQLRSASKQWDQKGRPSGLLWHGEAKQEALLFRKRFKGQLASRERAFLDEVVAMGSRTARRTWLRRGFAVVLLAAVAVAGYLYWEAEEEKRLESERALRAESEKDRATLRLTAEEKKRLEADEKRTKAEKLAAEAEALVAEAEALAAEAEGRVLSAEDKLRSEQDKLRSERNTPQPEFETAQRALTEAEDRQKQADEAIAEAKRIKEEAEQAVKEGNRKVEMTKDQLAAALRKAQNAKLKAEAESKRAQEASAKLQKLLEKERRENEALKLESNKIKTGRLQ